MKKIFFIIIILWAMPFFVSATQLDIATDKTTYTADELIYIRLSVDGSVDNGQVGIQGLENFDIVGKRASQSMQTINGQTSVVQKQDLTLRPHAGGQFTITALAQEDGQEISSQVLTLNIEKSPTQSLKEELLSDMQKEEEKSNVVENGVQNQNLKNIINKQESVNDFDVDLLRESQKQPSTSNKENSISPNTQVDQLQLQKIENFAEIQSNSAFNAFFWLEVLGIIIVLVIIGTIIIYVSSKKKLLK